MSRKPQIKISYPDASEMAMMLTDAMIRRAPGKRVVETTSEDKSNTDEGGSLLDGLDSVRTSTGVEMTLTLDPNSMDYALQQLIRPNLTEEERKRIFHEDSARGNDIFSAQAAEAPGQALDGGSSSDAPSDEREAATQSGEQEERNYSYKTFALFGLILATIELLKPTKRDSPANTLLHYLTIAKEHLEKNSKDAEADFLHALHIGWTSAYNQPQMLENARGLVDRITERLYDEDHPKPAASEPSWDDVEKEAQTIGRHKTDKTDKTDDIEPGLLDDIDEADASTAAVGSASLADGEEKP